MKTSTQARLCLSPWVVRQPARTDGLIVIESELRGVLLGGGPALA
jgi:hypothetical protein